MLLEIYETSSKRGLVLSSGHFVGPASAGIITISAFISSRSQKIAEDYRSTPITRQGNLNGESSRAMRKLIIPISIVLVVLAFLNAALGLYAGGAALALVALATFVAAVLLLSAILARPKTEARRPAAETVSVAPTTLTANQSNAEVVNFLAILQEKGRLVDFLMDDIKGYSDAQVGAAARVLHEGCRAVLLEHFGIRPVREESEGSKVTVPAGYAPDECRLVGKIRGEAPFSGVLVHHGWRTESVKLPRLLRTGDDRLPTIARCEIELK